MKSGAAEVPPDLLVETPRRHRVELGQIALQHDPVPSDQPDPPLKVLTEQGLAHLGELQHGG